MSEYQQAEEKCVFWRVTDAHKPPRWNETDMQEVTRGGGEEGGGGTRKQRQEAD